MARGGRSARRGRREGLGRRVGAVALRVDERRALAGRCDRRNGDGAVRAGELPGGLPGREVHPVHGRGSDGDGEVALQDRRRDAEAPREARIEAPRLAVRRSHAVGHRARVIGAALELGPRGRRLRPRRSRRQRGQKHHRSGAEAHARGAAAHGCERLGAQDGPCYPPRLRVAGGRYAAGASGASRIIPPTDIGDRYAMGSTYCPFSRTPTCRCGGSPEGGCPVPDSAIVCPRATDVVLAHPQRRHPRVRAHEPAAVVDRHEELTAHLPRERDGAGLGREDRRADRRRDVDAAMAGAVGIVGRVEPADHRTGDGPHPGPRCDGRRRVQRCDGGQHDGGEQRSTDHGGDATRQGAHAL